MRKYFNKLYLSIALVVLSLLTMVATTYAWVGLLTSTTFDEFTINLQEHESDEISEYTIKLSLDGINFYDNINSYELKRYLLHNIDPTGIYKDYVTKNSQGKYIVSDNVVERDYSKLRVDQCTVERPEEPGGYLSTRLGYFKNMKGEVTHNLLKFDLYLAIEKNVTGGEEDQSEKKLDLYLRGSKQLFTADDSASGIYSFNLFNSVTYPNSYGSYLGQPILGDGANQIHPNQTVNGNVKVDITTSCRVAIEKFKAMPKGDPSNLTYDDEIFIYQTGSFYPTYNSSTGLYDFGGILPSEYNFARVYYNTIYNNNPLGEVPDLILRRGDTIYQDDGNVNHIVNQGDGVTTDKMVCLRIYFWYEGWDSNCFEIIDNKKVTLNLEFNTKGPNED